MEQSQGPSEPLKPVNPASISTATNGLGDYRGDETFAK